MQFARSIGVWISFLLCCSAYCQDTSVVAATKPSATVVVSVYGNAPRRLARMNGRVFKKQDPNEIEDRIQELAYAEGFILYSIDRKANNDTIVLDVDLGESYQWSHVKISDEAGLYLRKARVNERRFVRKPVSPSRLNRVFKRTISYMEDNGFPFAEIKMDTVSIEKGEINGQIVLNKGPLVLVDSLIIAGEDIDVRETFVANYIGLKEGKPYSEKAVRNADTYLNQVNFLSVWHPVEVRFNDTETRVTLFLKNKKASRFDGIVGFLPDEKTGKILFTGDVSLHLENALKQGEVVDLNWSRLQTNTQHLNVKFVLPYVLNTPLSPDMRVKIYRRDTTFTDLFGQFGLRFVFNRNNYVRGFIDRQSTNLISTEQYENTFTIPEYLDRTIISYGLGTNFSKVDYMLNPSRGIGLELDVAVGNKTIVPNANLPAFIYDSLELTTIQYRSNLDLTYYIPIVSRLIWHQQYLGGSLLNSQLFNNEAYRIGGLKSIRGFNEESIFATTFGIVRSELRYQIERNGYVFALFDQGWYENKSLNAIGAKRDTPYALGLGLTLGTRAGIFSFSTAVGSQQGNPFLVRATKFHFGFLSVF